ncbi:MAG: hypothetical protein P1U77_27840, partial [Rubripirellula sp.]|nr:hypothetical protein [Rubripirellula sp.]
MKLSRHDQDLVNGYCSGSLSKAEFAELENRLRESREMRRLLIEYRSIEAGLPSAIAAGGDEQVELRFEKKSSSIRRLRFALLATAAGFLLMFGLNILGPGSEPQLATLDSLTGSVRWTGTGGQVVDDVQSGRALTGGTIE